MLSGNEDRRRKVASHHRMAGAAPLLFTYVYKVPAREMGSHDSSPVTMMLLHLAMVLPL